MLHPSRKAMALNESIERGSIMQVTGGSFSGQLVRVCNVAPFYVAVEYIDSGRRGVEDATNLRSFEEYLDNASIELEEVGV